LISGLVAGLPAGGMAQKCKLKATAEASPPQMATRRNSGGLSEQAILGALFAFPLETEFKRAIPVMFPSIQPTDLAASGTALDRHSSCGNALPCRYHEDSHARKARHA